MSTSPDAAPATDPPEPGNTPVRRRRTDGARHGRKSAPTPLRAARSGALWAAIVAWSAAIWLKDYSHGFSSDYLFGEWQAHSTAILLLFQVFACIVRFFEYFSVDLVERSRRLDALRLSAAPTTMGIGIILAFIPWWQGYTYTGRAAVLPTLIMIALILQSTRWILSVILRIRQGMREAADEDAAALPAEPELGMRRGRRRWAWPLAAVSFIAPAVPLAISAAVLPLLSPDLRVHAEQSVAAPIPDDALPAVPTAIPTQVAWTVEVSTADGGASLAPGARGPVVAADQTIQGLDGETGDALWTYRVTNGRYSDATFRKDRPFLVSSPDRKHLAVIVETADPDFEDASSSRAVIVDTLTGRATAEQPMSESHGLVQLTDSAALIENRVIALADGSEIGTISSMSSASQDRFSGTAGHSTFLVPEEGSTRNLMAIPDSDLIRTTSIGRACEDETDDPGGTQVTQNGWTAICEVSDSRTSDDAMTISALNLDEAAMSGDARSAGRVSLGKGTSVNREASIASGDIITLPISGGGEDRASTTPPIKNPWAETVFDPRTQVLLPAGQSSSIGTALLQDIKPDYGGSFSEQALRLVVSDDSTPLTIPISSAASFDASARRFYASPSTVGALANPNDVTVDPMFSGSASPGCLAIMVRTDRDRRHGGTGQDLAIYGVR